MKLSSQFIINVFPIKKSLYLLHGRRLNRPSNSTIIFKPLIIRQIILITK